MVTTFNRTIQSFDKKDTGWEVMPDKAQNCEINDQMMRDIASDTPDGLFLLMNSRSKLDTSTAGRFVATAWEASRETDPRRV